MSQENKTAIQLAEKKLEMDRKEQLQQEVYQYLKGELDSIDNIDKQVRDLVTRKKAHEENIKNIKQGNLEAIEKRRQNLNLAGTISFSGYINPLNFYSSNVAGFTYTTGSGRTYIF